MVGRLARALHGGYGRGTGRSRDAARATPALRGMDGRGVPDRLGNLESGARRRVYRRLRTDWPGVSNVRPRRAPTPQTRVTRSLERASAGYRSRALLPAVLTDLGAQWSIRAN